MAASCCDRLMPTNSTCIAASGSSAGATDSITGEWSGTPSTAASQRRGRPGERSVEVMIDLCWATSASLCRRHTGLLNTLLINSKRATGLLRFTASGTFSAAGAADLNPYAEVYTHEVNHPRMLHSSSIQDCGETGALEQTKPRAQSAAYCGVRGWWANCHANKARPEVRARAEQHRNKDCLSGEGDRSGRRKPTTDRVSTGRMRLLWVGHDSIKAAGPALNLATRGL